jgi:hypothetical protein
MNECIGVNDHTVFVIARKLQGPHDMPDRWIVISLDALANLALGAYGSSWNATPQIDRLAAAGILWDRTVASFDDTLKVLRDCWMVPIGNVAPADGTSDWVARWRRLGRVELILGDDLSGREQTKAIADLAGQAGFDCCTTVELQLGDQPADEIASTALAQLFAALLERLQESQRPLESPVAPSALPWSILWLHSDLLARHWDAPRWLFPVDDTDENNADNVDEQSLQSPDSDDFAVDDVVAGETTAEPNEAQYGHESNDWDQSTDNWSRPIAQSFNLLPDPSFDPTLEDEVASEPGPPELVDSVVPPSYRIAPGDHPDWVMTWMQTYGCQVRLVDQLIGMLVQTIDQMGLDIGIALIGTSGFSLGQNGWIGHRVGPLASPQIHVPAILCAPVGPTLRWPALAPLASVLQQVVPGVKPISPDSWAGLSDCHSSEKMPLEARTYSNRAASAVTTDQWFFVEDNNGVRLFSKPDDRDDVNDVANRCRDIVEEFRRKLPMKME